MHVADEDKGTTAMTSMAVGSVARMLCNMPRAVQLDDPGQEGTITIPALLTLLKQHRLQIQLPLVSSWMHELAKRCKVN